MAQAQKAGAMGLGMGAALIAQSAMAMAAAAGAAYVVHGAQTCCSCGLRNSHVVVPVSHGCYIHSIAQLTVGDYKGEINVQNFGGCTSPENPSVQAAAQAIVDKMKKKKKSFLEKVCSFFCKEEDEMDDSFVSQCAGVCTPMIVLPWSDGKSSVRLDGEKPLLFKSTLSCLYAGAIKLVTTGQPQ